MNCRHCDMPWDAEYEYCPLCQRNYGGAKYPETQTAEELHDVEELIQQIHRAFADVTLGDSETLHQADLEGAYSSESVWLAAGTKDPETHWSEVPDWKLEMRDSALSFLDEVGWRFYIPAFMCWTLKNWRTTDSVTPSSVIWSLTKSDWDFVMKRYELLDRAQSEAIYDFLEFFDRYSGEADAGVAIRSYWHQFKKD
jgi:hypothetical protein